MRHSKGSMITAASVVVLVLSGCSGSDSDTAAEGAEASLTIASDFGETVIPAEPQAGLGTYTTDIDFLITLGIPLASEQPVRSDNTYVGFPEYLDQTALEGVSTFAGFPEVNYEATLAAAPDFILNSLAYDEESVERLPQIAPTLSFNGFDGTNWRELFENIATQLGREDKHAEWVERYESKIEEAKEELSDLIADNPVVSPLGYREGAISATCWATCQVLEDMGFQLHPLAGNHLTDDAGSVSLESLQELNDVDIAIAFAEPTGENSLSDQALQQNPLWNGLDFVQSGQIAEFPREMQYGSPSADMALIDILVEQFKEYQAQL